MSENKTPKEKKEGKLVWEIRWARLRPVRGGAKGGSCGGSYELPFAVTYDCARPHPSDWHRTGVVMRYLV